MKRVFLAIRIPVNPELESYLKSVQNALHKDKIKWVEPQNLHLTLQFFGPIPGQVIQRYTEACKNILRHQQAFDLHLNELGVFGSRYAPRVLWLGLEPENHLKELKQELLEDFIAKGYRPNRQNFVPHLTLARIKEVQSKTYFQKVVNQYRKAPELSFPIQEILLYESILHKEGPEYRVIEKFVLQS